MIIPTLATSTGPYKAYIVTGLSRKLCLMVPSKDFGKSRPATFNASKLVSVRIQQHAFLLCELCLCPQVELHSNLSKTAVWTSCLNCTAVVNYNECSPT